MMEEQWKLTQNPDYAVSSLGRVASTKKGWVCLRPRKTVNGYLGVTLFANGDRCPRSIHRLVAEAFHGERPTPKHQVNHKDGDRENNQADNLEWVTQAENMRHRFDVLKHAAPRGEDVGNSKLTEDKVREIRALSGRGEPQHVIANRYGIGRAQVSRIAARKTWREVV